MLESHNICNFSVFDQSFEPFDYLGHRDKQVIRQCIQNFSTVISMIRFQSLTPKILETGSGLSTIVFSKLLTFPGESLKTIDAFAHDAIQINSRGAGFKISDFKNCEIIKGITIDESELSKFYSSRDSTLISLPHEKILLNLDLFLNFNLDDRKYQKITNFLNNSCITTDSLKNYFFENGFLTSDLIRSYKTENDEFTFLKNNSSKPVLRKLLYDYQPNIIYLDSGEFSSNIEFNIIDEFSKKGTLLIVQDIFFPKSIKSFLIASAVMVSERWQVLWIDRTTPQGIMVCRKTI